MALPEEKRRAPALFSAFFGPPQRSESQGKGEALRVLPFFDIMRENGEGELRLTGILLFRREII